MLRREALAYLRDNPGLVTRVPVGGRPPQEAEIAQSVQMMLDEGRDRQTVLAQQQIERHSWGPERYGW